jgi:RNA polymerase sporulation-specific sigma factor
VRRETGEMMDDMNTYDSMDDTELIRRFRAGEVQIGDYLVEKYKPLVKSKARELFLAGGDHEDLLQEGMIGLFRAVREYDEDREASFRTFALLLVTRQMYSAIQGAQRQKHKALNSSVSISELQDNQEEGKLGVVDSPETTVLDRENAEVLRQRIDGVLSPLERKVLNYYLEGMDYRMIAERMERSPKSIDNTLQRIRRKVSHL